MKKKEFDEKIKEYIRVEERTKKRLFSTLWTVLRKLGSKKIGDKLFFNNFILEKNGWHFKKTNNNKV